MINIGATLRNCEVEPGDDDDELEFGLTQRDKEEKFENKYLEACGLDKAKYKSLE